MKNLLIILAHPDYKKSIANKTIINKILEKYPLAQVRDLYKLYPDFKIDVKTEQDALLNADIVMLQYPFFWYNMPGMLKHWFDVVFVHDFAYGASGDKLKGKYLFASFTVGGNKESYSALGYNHFRVSDFTKNLEQTAYLSQMIYVAPEYGFGNSFIPNIYNSSEVVEERATKEADSVFNTLTKLMEIDAEGLIHFFIKDWFAHLDMFADVGYFLLFLDADVDLDFPEGKYKGHDGFSAWYSPMKEQLKSQSKHTVSEVEIKPLAGKKFEVKLLVHFEAETLLDEKISMYMKEYWHLELMPNDKVKIISYKAREVKK